MEKQDYFLVADGGSTKVDWMLVGNNEIVPLRCAGINPFVLDEAAITKELRKVLLPQLKVDISSIKDVFFYGSGCSNQSNCKKLEGPFKEVFYNAKVLIDHDMIGNALAMLGESPGVACILGTGSNCCVFDGKEILSQLHNLGYLAGDEGSGNHIGKLILQSYCYGSMPSRLRIDFIETYKLSPKEIVKELYDVEKPNAYLASYVPFLTKHIKTDYTKGIIRSVFKDFIEKNVKSLEFPKSYPLYFCGSIAYYFKDFLQPYVEKEGFVFGEVIRKPIDGLVSYHQAQMNKK